MSHIKQLVLLLIFITDSSGDLNAQDAFVRDIRIHGCSKVSEAKMLEAIHMKIGEKFDLDIWNADLRRMLDLYTRHGMILTSIDSSGAVYSHDGVALHAYVTERDVPVIDSVAMDGHRSLSTDELMNVMETRPGREFSASVLEGDIEALLDLYEQNGRPFAKARLTDLRLTKAVDPPGLSFQLQIEEGPPVRITSWKITGASSVRSEVITREFQQTPPFYYNRRRLERGLVRIHRLPFIAEAQMGRLLRHSDTSWTAEVQIAEGPSNSIDGVLGYVPSQTGASGYFAGYADLRFTNLLGTARQLHMQWQKRDRYSAYFQMAYTEPWVGGVPVDVTVAGEWLLQDTTFVDQAFRLSGEYRVNAEWSVTAGVKRRFIKPTDDIIAFLSGTAGASIWTGLFSISYDTRDDGINPRRGLLYKAGIDYNRRTEGRFVEDASGPDSLALPGGTLMGRRERDILNTQQISMDLETIFSLNRRLVVFNAAHAVWYRSPGDLPDPSDLVPLGGLKTLRGYPEEFFEGSRVLWNNFEIRWLTGRRSRVFAFVDAGYYLRKTRTPTSIRNISGRPIGYGFGFRYETRAGIMALDFGLGQRDAFSQTKVHVGLATQF